MFIADSKISKRAKSKLALKEKTASLLSINDAFRKIIIVNQPIMSGYN